MAKIYELKLAKDLIKFPSITPKDAGAINFLSKQLKSLGFNCKVLEFKDTSQVVNLDENSWSPSKIIIIRSGGKVDRVDVKPQ